MADLELAIGSDDDPVRPESGPVQDGPQAGLPAPVPDARQDRRRRDRRSAVRQLHADSAGRPLRGPRRLSRRLQPSCRSQYLHQRTRRRRRRRSRLPEDDLHRRTQRAALCSGCELHAGSRSRDLLQQLGRDEVRLRAGHCHADQWHLRGRSADAGRGVLHLHLHASAGKQQADAGAFLPGRHSGTTPDWITTTCGQPAATNFPSQPSPQCVEGPPVTDGNYITTTCTKPLNTAGYAASCARQRWLDRALHQGDLPCTGSRRR